MLTAERIIELLGLVPHPEEGGHFRETYRSTETVPLDALAGRYAPRDAGANRVVCTQIYYLLTPTTFSALHTVNSDETFHHYMGDPVEQLWLHPDGEARVVHIGNDLDAGHRPQITVPHGTWQGARLLPGGGDRGFALLGCTVAPGFEFVDYSMDGIRDLPARCPEHAELIKALTPR